MVFVDLLNPMLYKSSPASLNSMFGKQCWGDKNHWWNSPRFLPTLVPTWEVFPKTFFCFGSYSQINGRAIKLHESNTRALFFKTQKLWKRLLLPKRASGSLKWNCWRISITFRIWTGLWTVCQGRSLESKSCQVFIWPRYIFGAAFIFAPNFIPDRAEVMQISKIGCTATCHRYIKEPSHYCIVCQSSHNPYKDRKNQDIQFCAKCLTKPNFFPSEPLYGGIMKSTPKIYGIHHRYVYWYHLCHLLSYPLPSFCCQAFLCP